MCHRKSYRRWESVKQWCQLHADKKAAIIRPEGMFVITWTPVAHQSDVKGIEFTEGPSHDL